MARRSTTPSDELPDRNLEHAEGEYGAGTSDLAVAAEMEETANYRVSSPLRDAIRRFRANWMAMLCFIIIAILVFGAIFAPWLRTTHDWLNPDYSSFNQSPSWHHWFGTDSLGRDQYTRLLYGLRIPFIVGFVGAAITVILGLIFGTYSGYFGGFTDALLSRFTDVMFAFPGLLAVILVVSLYGKTVDEHFGTSTGRPFLLTMVLAFVGWPPLMRFVRSLALGLKEQQFIEAARVSGSSNWTIIKSHLVPNMWGLILVQASFVFIGTISIESSLSLFGLGVSSPNPDLGVMIFDGKENIGYNVWQLIIPATVLGVLILAGTFVGDGLRDAVDPRSRG